MRFLKSFHLANDYQLIIKIVKLMSSSRKAIDKKATALMVLLCSIFGLQQVVLKAAGADISPVLQIALRSGMAAVLVILLMLIQHKKITLDLTVYKAGLLAGFLFALEYLLLGESLRFTTASHAVVFLYTAPIFAALGLHWFLPEERLQKPQWIGIGLSFIGIIIAFYSPDSTNGALTTDILWGDFLALMAGISWASTTVLIRCSGLSRVPATHTLFYQLVGGFILLTLAAIWLGQTGFNLTPIAIGSLLFQILIVSFGGLLLWFWLLRNYLASRLGILSFMTPLMGVIFGVLLLNEPLQWHFVIGSLFVFAGITLVSGYAWITHYLARRLANKS